MCSSAHPVTLVCEGCGLSAPLSRARAPLEPIANSIPVLAVVRPVEHGGDALPELHPLLLPLLLPLRGQLQQALGQVDTADRYSKSRHIQIKYWYTAGRRRPMTRV